MKALITGASSGIGKSISFELAKRGYDLTIIARRKDRLEELKKEIESKYKVKVSIGVYDLSDLKELKKFEKGEKNKKYDLIFNNAGFGLSDFMKQDEDRLGNMIDLNINTVVRLTHFFANEMKKENKGTIVNTASVVSYPEIFPGMATYAATKRFVRSFSRSVNQELNLQNKNNKVRVVSLNPGAIDTEFYNKENNTNYNSSKTSPEKFAEKTVRKILKGKIDITVGKLSLSFRLFSKLLPKKMFGKLLYKYNK